MDREGRIVRASVINGTREVRAAIGRLVWGNELVVELCGLYADPDWSFDIRVLHHIGD